MDGTSLIPNNGNQTQKIPPTTSVKDNKVNSAAGIALDPIEYKIKPKTKPIKDFSPVFPSAIIMIPTVAIIIDIHTLREIFSLKNKNANNAVKKGIAAKQSKVTAALVFVIE